MIVELLVFARVVASLTMLTQRLPLHWKSSGKPAPLSEVALGARPNCMHSACERLGAVPVCEFATKKRLNCNAQYDRLSSLCTTTATTSTPTTQAIREGIQSANTFAEEALSSREQRQDPLHPRLGEILATWT